MRTKSYSILLIIILLSPVFFSIVSVKPAYAGLAGWGYYKSHLIIASPGAGTDYQTGIKVYYGDGTDGTETVNGVVFGKVYVNGSSRTDFGDIRFTDDDQITELDYWIENKTDSSFALFWVEVADTLENNATIYIYYNNSVATYLDTYTDKEHIVNTAIIGDNFDGSAGVPDASIWGVETRGVGGSTVLTGAGELTMTGQSSTISGTGILSVDTIQQGFMIHYRNKMANQYYNDVAIGNGDIEDGQGGTSSWWHARQADGYQFAIQANNNHFIYETPDDSAEIELHADTTAWGVINTYRVIDFSYDEADELEYWVNGIEFGDATDSTFDDGSYYVLFWSGEYSNGFGGTTTLDWVFIRKYIASEPVHSTWGAETVTTSYYLTTLLHTGIATLLVNGSSKGNSTETAFLLLQTANLTSTLTGGYDFSKWEFGNETIYSYANPAYLVIAQNETIHAYATTTTTTAVGDAGYAGTGFIIIAIVVSFAFILTLTRKR